MIGRLLLLATPLCLWLAAGMLAGGSASAGETTARPPNLRVPAAGHVQILIGEDGSRHVGRIVEVTPDEVHFETALGRLRIPVARIREVREVPETTLKAGQYWFPNPNATRLFFAPTARTLPRGEGYVSDTWIFFPTVAYGLSDRVTVAGGMSLFPGLEPSSQVYYVMPKVGLIRQEKFALALGALAGTVPDAWTSSDFRAAGSLHAVATFGDTNSSITAAVGVGFAVQRGDRGSKVPITRPTLVLGGEKRVARRLSLVTENWFFPGLDEPLGSLGVRFLGEKMSVDLALYNALGPDIFFPGVPYLDFTFHF